jgi:hypothetical protein
VNNTPSKQAWVLLIRWWVRITGTPPHTRPATHLTRPTYTGSQTHFITVKPTTQVFPSLFALSNPFSNHV